MKISPDPDGPMIAVILPADARPLISDKRCAISFFFLMFGTEKSTPLQLKFHPPVESFTYFVLKKKKEKKRVRGSYFWRVHFYFHIIVHVLFRHVDPIHIHFFIYYFSFFTYIKENINKKKNTSTLNKFLKKGVILLF